MFLRFDALDGEIVVFNDTIEISYEDNSHIYGTDYDDNYYVINKLTGAVFKNKVKIANHCSYQIYC